LKVFNLTGEVITTPFTFAATTNVILWEGLKPVFADIDGDTYNINPDDIEKKITMKTSAILAVHVYGNPCDVGRLGEIAMKHNLKLIYDAAHAFGVEYNGNSILNYGDMSTMSYHPTKVFHTIEGGAIIARDNKILKRLKLLRNHGIKSEEIVSEVGTNAKMDEFRAVMGLCNLEIVREKIKIRKMIYEHYKNRLTCDKIKFQKLIASAYNYSHMPVCFENIKVKNHVYSELIKNDIKPRKYFFPLTVNFDYFKSDLVKKYNLHESYDIANKVLCLPIYPDLDISTVNMICDLILKHV
jgi:dTDP-4-amino-4,6-dideoxygalactose transaminase